MSPRHQEGLAHLLYGINFAGGFVALTGEVGTGKTTLCRYLLQEIPENIEIALIYNSKLNAEELLATICDELSIHYDKNHQSLKSLIDLLNQHLLTAHANGKRTVLLIDEAQNLSMEVLEQIRLLTNLETSKAKLLQIILVGQPELKALLNRQDLRQLNQRITARYHLLPLSLDETRAYIRHRLIVCNGNPDLFKQSAIRKIYKLSAGIPRIVNILCDRALLGAYSTNATIISPSIIKLAANETLAAVGRKKSHLPLLFGMLLSVSIAAAIYHEKYWYPAKQQIYTNPTITTPIKPEVIKLAEQPIQLPTEKPIVAPVEKTKSFHEWINNSDYTLSNTLINALKLWGKPIPENNQVDCHYIETVGLHCVFGKANWKDLLNINRPAIMEFYSTSKQMPLALLTGLGKNNSTIYFNDTSFPVVDVLKEWNGYYLKLEPASIPNVKLIYPHQTSDEILALRHLLTHIDGINEVTDKPRFYDDHLVARVNKFQRDHQLPEDGKVGSKTMYYLKNIELTANFPHLKIVD